MSSGEEWRTKQKKERGRKSKGMRAGLASWCDSNRINKKLSGLVGAGEASTRAVDILKKYQAVRAVLNGPERIALVGELHGAGDWDAAAGKAVAPQQATPARRTAALSDGAKSARTFAAREAVLLAEVAALKKAAAGPRQARRRSKGRQSETPRATAAPLAARVTLTEAVPSGVVIVDDHADIEVEPKPPQWVCPACATDHDFAPEKMCRFCKLLRPVIGPTAQAETSAEEVALAVAKYKGLILAIDGLGSLASTGDMASKENCIAKIAAITKPKAPAAEPLPSVRHNAAMVALEAAQVRNATLVGVQLCIQQEIARKQGELDRIAIAMALAQQELQAAEDTLEAATRQLPAAATGPAAAQAASAVQAPQLGLRETLCNVVKSSLLNTEGEVGKKQTLYAEAEQTITEMVSRMIAEMAVTTTPQPAAAAVAMGVARAPPAKPAAAPAGIGEDGESRLPDRSSVKAGSMSETSRTQVAKEVHSKAQRVGDRDALFAQNRHEDLAAEFETERLEVGAAP